MDGKYQSLHVLVVGAGSVGSRHINNLNRMGVGKLTVVEPNQMHRRALHDIARDSNILSSLDGVRGVNAAMVCAPTSLHAELAVEIFDLFQVPIFVEKPLAHTAVGATLIKEGAEIVSSWAMVGYSLRHHPPLQLIKQLLEPTANFGKPLYVRAEVGQWLPDWHPGFDYRAWYMAKDELGGGAVTDLSHEIDYVCWLLGEWPISVQALVEHISRLEITTDDIAELTLKFPSGAVASIHMDLIQRVHRRRCLIACENGTIEWEKPDTVSSFMVGDQGWKHVAMDANRNIQFEREVATFLDGVLTGEAPSPTIKEGTKVLDIVLAAKESSKSGKKVDCQ